VRALRAFFAILLALAALAGAAAWLRLRPPGPALYVGGTILTMDGALPVAEALAVDRGRISGVGSAAEWRAWAERSGARVVDLGGRALLPGFVDAHSHFPGAGLGAVAADLSSPPAGSAARIDDLVARLRERAERAGARAWVVGFGYDDTLLAERRHPTRADLDRVSTEQPVVALHVSGHLAAVNGAGLARLGIARETPDPPGGRIRRDAAGAPDGVLEETAIDALAAEVLRPGLWGGVRIVRRATALYLAAGVTTAQNGAASAEQVRTLALLARLRLLPLRIVVWPIEEAAEALESGRLRVRESEWLRVGAVKLFADGSIQGYTGWLAEPYHRPPGGERGYRGYPRTEPAALAAQVARWHAAGRQVAIHGNGDAAIDAILDALEAAQRAHPRADARPVIVHAQTARSDQLDRIAALGAVPSFFGLHVFYWGDRHRDVFLGPERAARISPAASAARRGIPFALHADTPVVAMEPLRMAWAAVNRRTSSGAPLGESERVDALRALRALTLDAARETFLERDRGSLAAGKLADLVVLDRSPLDDPASLDRIRVLETIVGGRSVFRAR
jgi:hypothetical protein